MAVSVPQSSFTDVHGSPRKQDVRCLCAGHREKENNSRQRGLDGKTELNLWPTPGSINMASGTLHAKICSFHPTLSGCGCKVRRPTISRGDSSVSRRRRSLEFFFPQPSQYLSGQARIRFLILTSVLTFSNEASHRKLLCCRVP